MSTKIIVEYHPDTCGGAGDLRSILCECSRRGAVEGWNPLLETPFNGILQTILQQAFDEGRAFERKHPKLG